MPPPTRSESLAPFPDFLRSDGGEIFLAGHRVTLFHIVKDYREGCSGESLASSFPTVSPALIDKAIAFYLAHREEVEQYVEETRAEIERQASAPARGPSFDELQHRLESRRPSASA